MFTLFKYLTWLCMPYSIVIVGLALAAAWLLWRRAFRPALCVLLLDVVLVVSGLPAVSAAAGYALERKFPPTPLEAVPNADAIVVLGGGVSSATEAVPYPELFWSADRAIMAVRLFRAGKAPLVVPTGSGAIRAEKPLLESLGVPSASILCENEAVDTATNATKTFALLKQRGCKKVLVVTSAWHMPRAMMLFKGAPGMEFIPVGCDYEGTLMVTNAKERSLPFWMMLPNPESAGRLAYYAKEWLGILFYSFRNPPLEAEADEASGDKA